MKKELFNGKRLKVARIYRGKTIDQVSKETNINKKDILAFEENKYKPTVENALEYDKQEVEHWGKFQLDPALSLQPFSRPER